MCNILQNNYIGLSASHTYLYSPPEQVNQQRVHQKTDIWSLGVIMYELFTNKLITADLINLNGMYDPEKKGCLKYQPQNQVQLICHLKQFQDIISQSIEKLIEKMTCYNSEERFNSFSLLNELEKIGKLNSERSQPQSAIKLEPQKSNMALPSKTKLRKQSFLGKEKSEKSFSNNNVEFKGLMVKGIGMKMEHQQQQSEQKIYFNNQPQTAISNQRQFKFQENNLTQISKRS